VCGDGRLDAPGEQCDDGNTKSGDGCSSTCQSESFCGNGVREGSEQCDDQNNVSGDGCSSTCLSEAVCGDAEVGGVELCDPGKHCTGGSNPGAVCTLDPAACVGGTCDVVATSDCTAQCRRPAGCGNGVVEGTEQCDGTPGCRSDCTLIVCGDGVVDTGEQCDDGNTVSGDGCSRSCQLETVCGNGVVEGAEQCDDKNNLSGDGCSSTCQLEAVCGDGIVGGVERCDDGGTCLGGSEPAGTHCDLAHPCLSGGTCTPQNGDGCSSICRPEAGCGNGVLEGAEQCDSTPGCRSDCTLIVCGDGMLDTSEQCDDGNTVSGDGCSRDCQVELWCGDGIVTPALGEQCDDENNLSGDGCSSTCRIEPVCGDGVIMAPEECDDGKRCGGVTTGNVCSSDSDCTSPATCRPASGDGCSALCKREHWCGDGHVDPGELCDDGNNISLDGCSANCIPDNIF
jgi:cysteine-rich repeat protein